MKIAVLGALTRDRIIIKGRGEDYQQAGGGVYYVSRALASLGVQVFAFPLLAEKDVVLLDSLNHPKIQVIPQWTKATTFYQNTYFDETMDQCEKKLMAQASDYEVSESALALIETCAAVHLVPLSSNEWRPDVISKIRNHFKGLICLDGQGFTRGSSIDVKNLLQNRIDIIKSDLEETLQITKTSDENEAITELRKWGVREVVVTKGSLGSVVYFQNQRVEVPAIPAKKIIDATGCGDAYAAGYLSQRLLGKEPVVAAQFAAGFATQNLGVKGAL